MLGVSGPQEPKISDQAYERVSSKVDRRALQKVAGARWFLLKQFKAMKTDTLPEANS